MKPVTRQDAAQGQSLDDAPALLPLPESRATSVSPMAEAEFQEPLATDDAATDDTTSSDGAVDAAPFLERLDYSYQQTQEFAARCDASIAEARLTRERMEEVIVQQQELIALLRAQQVTQPAKEKEPSFKVLDRCVPELTDDPKAVEHWIQSAKEAIADMPAGVAVRALQDKLVGPQ
ncbi:hypothetical protein IW136_002594, partial [Coemansia sp. RSA 678]